MSVTISVVGANGRVGRAVAAHLRGRFAVREIGRRPCESYVELAVRAVDGADVLVNAAGVAHIASITPGDLERLRVGNVELPVALASAALAADCSLIHISSVKANEPGSSSYAASKREGDDRLSTEFGSAFAAAGASLVVLRPLAMLFPPLDAGKVRRLRFLGFVPARLVPPVSLPVLAPVTFLSAVSDSIDRALAGESPGCSIVEFGPKDRGTMRDIREAFIAAQEQTL